MSDIGNWGNARCTFIWTTGELIINVDGGSVIADDSSKAPWYNYSNNDKAKITSVNILGHISFNKETSLNNLFAYFNYCVLIKGLDNFDTSNVTNMSEMFLMTYYSSTNHKFTTLNISNWDTSNVTNMSQMFWGCEALEELNISNWDTSNVTSMSQMFYMCYSLNSINISNWNTSNVTSMTGMFSECKGLTELNITNFDTSNVTGMNSMFYGCSGLTELDVTNFDTSNVTNMNSMFYDCRGLTELDVTNFDTSNVTGMNFMFYGCSGLTELDVTNFDTSNVTNMNFMFYGCRGLTELDVSKFDTSNVTSMNSMFYNCRGLTELDVTNFDTSNVTNMSQMFYNCRGLITLDVSNWNTSKVTGMNFISNMFYECTNLTSIITPKVFSTVVKSYFKTHCSGWYDIDNNELTDSSEIYEVMLYRSDTSTSKVLTNTWNTDDNSCYWKLNKTTLTIYSTNNHNLGSNASDLTEQTDIKNNISNITKVSIRGSTVFKDSTNLSSLFNGFNNCTSIEGLDYFDLDNVSNLTMMFNGCTKLHSLNLSSWNLTDKTITDMLKDLTSLYYIITPTGFDSSFQNELYTKFSDLNYIGVKPKLSTEIQTNTLYFTKRLRWSNSLDNSCYWSYSSDNILTIYSDGTNNKANDSAILRNQFTINNIVLVKPSKVKRVVIEGLVSFIERTDLSKLFNGFNNCTTIEGLNYFNTANVTNMTSMFYGCSGLTELDVTNFDTSNVTNMNFMFYGCSGLTELDVTNFDTSNVTNMNFMFYGCRGLTKLDVSNFNTANVTNMTSMFYNCSSLKSIKLNNITINNYINLN